MMSFVGKVSSVASGTNTVKVITSRTFRHSFYKKVITRTKSFLCHVDSSITLSEGDKVEIVSTRPISRTKHFKVSKVLK